MISTLYPIFRERWSGRGSVWLLGDTHFEDADCPLMDGGWITPQEQVAWINKYVGKNDTFIHLGDVGNPEWMRQIRGYKVLLCGNHDRGASYYEPFFDEVYGGPLFIAEKILLSHEPVPGINYALNIHGHDHGGEYIDCYHLNLAANVAKYTPANLGSIIKRGVLTGIDSLHRQAVDLAVYKKWFREFINIKGGV